MTEGAGGKNCQNIDYVICERPLSSKIFENAAVTFFKRPKSKFRSIGPDIIQLCIINFNQNPINWVGWTVAWLVCSVRAVKYAVKL